MKTLKTITSVLLVAVMLGASLVCLAETEKQTAYVTVYDGKTVVCAMEEVAYADEDNDGKWTINDLLISIHNKKCKDGFKTSEGAYGLQIDKLWNVKNGGSYGYYLNDGMAMSIVDEVKAGDRLYAFVYSDAAGYSDAYSFFDVARVEDQNGKDLTLTLKYVSGFDENYAPVFSPVEGAVITVDGKATEIKTDAEGKATVKPGDKTSVISAQKEGLTLIPPVCLSIVTEKAQSPALLIVLLIVLAIVAAAAVCVIVFNKKKKSA